MHSKSNNKREGRARLTDPYVATHEVRKVMKVGGSVVVPIPAKLRKRLNIAPGDRMRIDEGPEGTIIMNVERSKFREFTIVRD